MKHMHKILTVLAGILVIAAAGYALAPAHSAPKVAALAPQAIGLGQGVAACDSSSPTVVTCPSTGTPDGYGVCQCPTGQHYVSGICVNICAGGATPDSSGNCPTTFATGCDPQTDGSCTCKTASGFSNSCPSTGGCADGTSVTPTKSCSYVLFLGTVCTYTYGACSVSTTVTNNPPATPANLRYSCSADNTYATLAWDAVPGAVYQPDVSGASSCSSPWLLYAGNGHCYLSGISGTSITFPTTPGTTYTENVMAWNSAGHSGWTSGVNFSCGRAANAPLLAPTGLSAACWADNSHFRMSWNPVAGATSYQVDVSGASSCTEGWSLFAANGHCYISPYYSTVADFPTTPGVTYYPSVEAWDSSGHSAWNNGAGISCNPAAGVSLQAAPQWIRQDASGNTTTLTYSASNVTGCTLKDGLGTTVGSFGAAGATPTTATYVASIGGQTTFTLSCNDKGGKPLSQSVTVKLIPKTIEQ